MARQLILKNLMKLAQSIGANPSKFMGTKTNITFLGKGPTKNPLFQRPLTGRDVPAAIHGRDGMIEAAEDAMGFATAGKLNDIQLKILTQNLSGLKNIYNPPKLPSASVTAIRPGIEGLRRFPKETHKFMGRPLKDKDFVEIDKLVAQGKIPGSRLPEPGPGDMAAFTAGLNMQTGMSRAIARNLLLKDTRLKLSSKDLSMLKEGKGEPLDLMKKYYGQSVSAYDDFLNNVNLQAARPDEFAAMILKNVRLIPAFAEGGLAGILQVPRSGYARGGWSPGVGRDERGYQSSHPSYRGGGGGGGGQGITDQANLLPSPITETGEADRMNFNKYISPSVAFNYSPSKLASLQARLYNQNILESDDVNLEGNLSGTIGPVDYNTQFTDQGFGNTNLNYGNFLANIDPNKNYNLGYQTNRDGVNTGATYDSDGNLMLTAGIKFNKGGLAGILEV